MSIFKKKKKEEVKFKLTPKGAQLYKYCRDIVNGTCDYVLESAEESLQEACEYLQMTRKGFAEFYCIALGELLNDKQDY